MIQFVKNHLITLLSGVVIVTCVVVTFLFSGSDKVEKAMDQAIQASGATSIRGLLSDPKNEEVIAAAEEETQRFQQEFEAAIEAAKTLSAREPLMAGVFPNEPDAAKRTRYAQNYAKAVTKDLMVQLSAGTLPTEFEIQEEYQNVQDLIALEQEQEAEIAGVDEGGGRQPTVASAGARGVRGGGGMMPPTANPRGGGGGMMPPTANPRGGGGMMPPSANLRGRGGMMPSSGGRTPAAIPSGRESEPKYNWQYRANVTKARSIRCYIDSPELTFHVSTIVGADTPPTPAEMWYAQVGLWIQQDIVRAIKAINGDAAAAVADGEAYVEHMPIKRLMGIQVLGYDTGVADPKSGSGGFIEFPRRSPAPGFDNKAGMAASFTDRKSNEQYDIVRFQIALVVDQREVLEVVDRLSRANFFQCTNMAYHAYDAAARDAEQAQGYFYGTAPIVQLTLDFEAYLLRSAFVDLMPKDVKIALGIEKESEK